MALKPWSFICFVIKFNCTYLEYCFTNIEKKDTDRKVYIFAILNRPLKIYRLLNFSKGCYIIFMPLNFVCKKLNYCLPLSMCLTMRKLILSLFILCAGLADYSSIFLGGNSPECTAPNEQMSAGIDPVRMRAMFYFCVPREQIL